jgi:hypothetical protein
MPTTTHLDEHTRRGPRTRRDRRRRPGPGRVLARRPTRATAAVAPRYPDDPTGNYETTDGGW